MALKKLNIKYHTFFFGGQGLNLGPCIFYALFIPTELNSQELLSIILNKTL